jgi:ubiquitin C-terminal hydrolase
MLPLPSILVIQLKRWKSNESKRAAPRELVTHAVRIQSVLNLDKAKYELAAVVRMHTEGAHYTAFAKRAGRGQTKQWYLYNDARDPVEVEEAMVLRGEKAYILFYRLTI